jgi:hypothetical protein
MFCESRLFAGRYLHDHQPRSVCCLQSHGYQKSFYIVWGMEVEAPFTTHFYLGIQDARTRIGRLLRCDGTLMDKPRNTVVRRVHKSLFRYDVGDSLRRHNNERVETRVMAIIERRGHQL